MASSRSLVVGFVDFGGIEQWNESPNDGWFYNFNDKLGLKQGREINIKLNICKFIDYFFIDDFFSFVDVIMLMKVFRNDCSCILNLGSWRKNKWEIVFF